MMTPQSQAPAEPDADPDPDADDATVIQLSRREPEQFTVLFRRHAPHIQRYVVRRLGSDAADDVVAEAFLLAFRQRDRYDPARADARPVAVRHRHQPHRPPPAGRSPPARNHLARSPFARIGVRWRLALAAGLAAGLAGGLVAVVQPSGQPSGPRSAQLPALTAKLLADRASAAALAGPEVPAGQWIYQRTVTYSASPPAGFPPTRSHWTGTWPS